MVSMSEGLLTPASSLLMSQLDDDYVMIEQLFSSTVTACDDTHCFTDLFRVMPSRMDSLAIVFQVIIMNDNGDGVNNSNDNAEADVRIGTAVKQLRAIDPDVNSTLTYRILQQTSFNNKKTIGKSRGSETNYNHRNEITNNNNNDNNNNNNNDTNINSNNDNNINNNNNNDKSIVKNKEELIQVINQQQDKRQLTPEQRHVLFLIQQQQLEQQQQHQQQPQPRHQQQYFKINETTGQISTSSQLDYELHTKYILLVQVR
ncbi:hypothetical protein HELRODRAFT_183495 [Helobdella robusta]|uniref:Cadherin domain-containing protein n=1 Tax=Helobdella robusta TaxID=6412 RepID=T1FJR5_HELRO|nr:hypothetical protein HELRODRAFT_183495 [Helobdella robusta]ESO11113.1 hypothetical protein HELRODRAFT_183495 [Helobdella robusta]